MYWGMVQMKSKCGKMNLPPSLWIGRLPLGWLYSHHLAFFSPFFCIYWLSLIVIIYLIFCCCCFVLFMALRTELRATLSMSYTTSPFLFWDSTSLSCPGLPWTCNSPVSAPWVPGDSGMHHHPGPMVVLLGFKSSLSLAHGPELTQNQDVLIPLHASPEVAPQVEFHLPIFHWSTSSLSGDGVFTVPLGLQLFIRGVWHIQTGIFPFHWQVRSESVNMLKVVSTKAFLQPQDHHSEHDCEQLSSYLIDLLSRPWFSILC